VNSTAYRDSGLADSGPLICGVRGEPGPHSFPSEPERHFPGTWSGGPSQVERSIEALLDKYDGKTQGSCSASSRLQFNSIGHVTGQSLENSNSMRVPASRSAMLFPHVAQLRDELTVHSLEVSEFPEHTFANYSCTREAFCRGDVPAWALG